MNQFPVTELLAGDISQLLTDQERKLSERLDWCYQAAQGFCLSYLHMKYATDNFFAGWLGYTE
jgi:hypothetical protein